ncbi:MAG: HD domain-containing protein [Alphaproteobacteria bacterium]|nr:HD domain-containing protein [Alphaproteobacteria bacterium]MBT4710228.1 HD domain-containing protein [Alphaproteobacteria bacterium]MBT5860950.1 HD domain-containing protein [Alphaproteobacteria bacterium]
MAVRKFFVSRGEAAEIQQVGQHIDHLLRGKRAGFVRRHELGNEGEKVSKINAVNQGNEIWAANGWDHVAVTSQIPFVAVKAKLAVSCLAALGYDMLKNSKKRILRSGAIIALEHHEKWDGSGYPHQKKGSEIELLGRITAVADVFDAVGSERCYKKAWPLDEVLDLLEKGRDSHFDSSVIDVFMGNLDKITNIRDRYSDAPH